MQPPSESPTGRPAHQYLRWLALTVSATVAACAGLVLVADPYGLYQAVNRPGFNAVKPPLSRHVNEIKLSQVRRLAPAALIVGNSRAEIGFDPESEALAKLGLPAYNLAIRGTSIDNVRRQVEYLRREQILPGLVLAGLDFVDFVNAKATGPAPAPAPEQPINLGGWFWRFDSLFSMASLKDALGTLLIQSNPEADSVTERGFNPLKPYLGMARREGYFALFRQRAEENAATYLRKAGGGLGEAEFADLRRIFELSAGTGGELVMVVYPYHAQIAALFEEAGLWPVFEEWKARVVAEMDAARLAHPGLRVRLLDFSGYSPRQCEKIPPKGDLKQETRWYWEAGHFKKGLGDFVLERALSASPGAVADFGMPLERDTLEPNRRRIAAERDACAAGYPQLFAEARDIVSAKRAAAGRR